MANRPRKPTENDRERADKAIATLPARDQSAIRRVMEWSDEDKRFEAYRAMPKDHYFRLSRRQSKTITAQAKTYGLPIGDGPVDLFLVLPWFHDFLAENGKKLFTTDGENPMSGPSSPALEKWREEKWKLAKLDRQKKQGELLPAEIIHDQFMLIASIIRKGGEAIGKHFGPAALDMYSEMLDNVDRALSAYLDGLERETTE